MRNRLGFVALRISLIYALIGALWILLSDQLLIAIVSKPAIVNQLQTYKGWAFVGVTTSLLYCSLRRQLREWDREAAARRQAEETMRLSEERFRLAMRGANDGLWDWNLKTDDIYFSPRWKSMLGYAEGDLENHQRTWDRLIHPDDRDVILDLIGELLEGRSETFEAEYRMRHRDGHYLHILSRAFLVKQDHGGALRLVGTHVDITDRKRAEAQIRSHAERLAALTVALEQRVAERTAELARVNAELTQANAGLQAEIADRMQLEEQIRSRAARASALAELSQVLAETSLEYQPLFDTIARRIAELMGDICSVTLLSDDRQYLEPVAIYHPDAEGAAFMREMVAASPYRLGAGLAGRVAETGQALLVPVVTPAQARAAIKPEYASYLDRFGMASLLIVPLRARGQILGTLGVSRAELGRPYNEEDQAFLQDLADRAGQAIETRRLFVELRQAREEADRANSAKSAFLTSVSHELRTPLNAIIGFTGTLLMKLPGPLNADQQKHLRTIQINARHLLSLINDLLDLARIESGKAQVARAPVECQAVIEEVAASQRLLADQKGLLLSVHAPAEPLVIESDRRALSQIVINLVSNAIKFTDQGEVRIALARGSADGQARVLISVADTGIGIRDEDLPQLFQEFGRVAASDGHVREGTGLGLRLSQKLAQLLGGQIVVQSEHGAGSTFTLQLPE